MLYILHYIKAAPFGVYVMLAILSNSYSVIKRAEKMKKGLKPTVGAVALFLSMSLFAAPMIGLGTSANPYQISTCAQLQAISNKLSANYVLTQNINCAPSKDWDGNEGFMPIGASSGSFAGELNGNGYTVYDLTINGSGTLYAGLFSQIAAPGSVSNLKLDNVQINSTRETAGALTGWLKSGAVVSHDSATNVNILTPHANAAGGLVGVANGFIQNSSSSGFVEGYGNAGGLVGIVRQGFGVVNSYAAGVVESSFNDGYVGGLVGLNSGSIQNSYTTANAFGPYNVGGLVGWSQGSASVSNSYATGVVQGPVAGGLIGTNNGSVSQVYSIGQVHGTVAAGGLIGRFNGGSLRSGYYDTQTSGQDDTGKGAPESTANMMQVATFKGWNFNGTWQITSGHDYPVLKWQSVPFRIRILNIPSPQKIDTPFPITLLANNSEYNGEVVLYSTRGPVFPAHVQLTNGAWSGDVTMYTPGDYARLQARWINQTGELQVTSESNPFYVLDEDGTQPADGSVLGHVLTENGSPIAGANVYLYDQNPNNYPTEKWYVKTKTNSNGEYSLLNILLGNYYIKVALSGYQPLFRQVKVASLRSVTYDYNLYSWTCNAQEKTPVLLVPGIMGSTKRRGGFVIYPRLTLSTPAWDSGKLKLLDPASAVGWGNLEKSLQALGYNNYCTLFTVPYDWSLTVPRISKLYLIPWIREAEERTGSPVVDIVAHSMGGLVTRSYLQSSAYAHDVNKFAMVGTPNKGSDNVYYIFWGG